MNLLTLEHINKTTTGSDFQLTDISFTLGQGKILALVGESGCGKTTLLRIIAGLEIPDSGFLTLDNRMLFSKEQWVPSEQRNIGFVFQDYALFPHLTVKENISFGIDGLNTDERNKRLSEMLDLVDMKGYEDRYPGELSGGEQQRVALARALAMRPKVLLLDEPFSNLDYIKKEALKAELKLILEKTDTTTVFVTHDTTEALYLADKIIVLKDGKILQQGDSRKIYNFPINKYVAAFFGKANFFETTLSDQNRLLPFDINLKKINPDKHNKFGICIRPNGFVIHERAKMKGSITNIFFLGNLQELHVEFLFQEILYQFIIHTEPQTTYTIGQEINFEPLPEAVHFLLGD